MSGLRSLRQIAAPKPAPTTAPKECCELCAVEMGERHGHVADVAEHRLLCVCRPCYLLFAPEGAGGGHYRAVGEEVRRVDDLRMEEVLWDALKIPVDLAFFLEQTGADAVTSFYPGPAGATESLLDLAAWAQIVAENPVVGTAQPDVEAVLLRRHDGGFSCYLVPIDVCYELVGVVRTAWTGLGGGPEVWRLLQAFFDGLDARATVVPRSAGRDD